ncbi:MAG: right-handed parallel beta-helix repeat-containing protein [bacterium]|nr:right-handed parallel beta-helix repeat-containing protein [bacterium]
MTAASTYRVPLDFVEIQSAIDAASSGDTILVAPKTYRVNLDFLGKDILLCSEAGPEVTILQQEINDDIVSFTNGEGPNAILRGFTLLGGTAGGCAVRIANASPTIEGNYLKYHHSYAGGQPQLYVRYSGSPTIRDNFFLNDDSLRMAIWAWGTDPVYIYNNTLYGGGRGIYISATPAVIRNNIAVNTEIGIVNSSIITEDHNNAWGNTVDYSGDPPDVTSLSVDPLFIDTSNGNCLLMPGSPCIDAGNPSSAFNDPDGTIGDIGAFYFDQLVPAAYNLGIIGEEIGHVMNPDPIFHWSFYGIEQEGFRIEVGTDNDWSTAENWTYNSGLTTDTLIAYAGVPLQNGMTYYYRIRVSDSASIGHWVQSVFRLNGPPAVPVPYWPTSGTTVSVKGVQLWVMNPNEPEGDSLFLDYEVYFDPGLTNLVTSVTSVPEQRDSTGSGYLSSLTPGLTYYWRCRASDKWEYSNWSSPASFIVRPGIVLHVPGTYETIQAGINAAQQGDTVLVADGIYSGDGNRDLTFNGVNIILKSENGHSATGIVVGGSESDRHRAISLESGEDSSSVVDGFTIGYGYVDQAAIFTGYSGGAITLKNCLVTECSDFGMYTSGWERTSRIENCHFNNNGLSGVYLYAPAIVTHSIFDHNGAYGLITQGWNLVDISNCTFVANKYDGFVIEGEPPIAPKSAAQAEDSSFVYNCVAAYNGGCGFGQIFWSRPLSLSCNNSYGNLGYDQYCTYDYLTGENGNVSQQPFFCDTTLADYHISDQSPCAPANNSCSVLMGAYEVACTGCCVHRGDIDHSGGTTPVDISDITAFVEYIFAGAAPPICPEEGDVDGSGTIDITDLTVMVDFIFNGGSEPPPCP